MGGPPLAVRGSVRFAGCLLCKLGGGLATCAVQGVPGVGPAGRGARGAPAGGAGGGALLGWEILEAFLLSGGQCKGNAESPAKGKTRRFCHDPRRPLTKPKEVRRSRVFGLGKGFVEH